MSTNRFTRYMLRTTDAPAATAFYASVIDGGGDAIFPLHEQAVARGARSHWLGFLDVASPETTAGAFLADGGERFGVRPDGVVVIRDPGGALVAFGNPTAPGSTKPVEGPSRAGVVWHVLRTRDAGAAADRYARQLGWSLGETVDLGATGSFRLVAFAPGEPPAGVVGGIETTPGVHAQWLFFFGVPSLDAALEKVRALGGTVAASTTLPDGRRSAVCDDPQGAAFGLMQR